MLDILVSLCIRTQYVHIYSFISIQQNHHISSQTLTELNLSYNDIETEGARYIGLALQYNKVNSRPAFHIYRTQSAYLSIDTY